MLGNMMKSAWLIRTSLLGAKSTLAFPAAPFPHLLRSNIAPSPLELSAVSKAIFDAEALRSFLDSQLIERKASANLIWKAMKKQKIQRLEKFIAAHKAIISAIRRIPPEIIQDIFQWLSAILRDGWEANSKSEPKWALPFAYGQICSSWRSSALSVYSLWSLFPDIRKPKSRVGNELQLKYMTELLRRSRQSPIQFSFDAALWNRDPYPTADLLIQSSERWQVIEISGTAMGIYKYFHTILGRIPNLERLTISVVMFDGDSDVLDMFQVAPKLRKVQLSGHRIDDIKLPNYQLVDFTSVVVHARNPLSQLTNAHHLEILYYESRSPGPITNVNMISLPSLKRLFVVLHQSFPPVLDFLTVPILEGLHITDLLNVLDSALLRSIVGMASRSGNLPHLQELHIWSTLDEMPEGLDEILRLTPALRLLDTPIPSPHDILAIASTKMGSLPLVSSLEFCYFGATKVLAPEIFSAMKEFTDSRCELLHQYDTPLRGLSLTTNCGQWWNTTTSQGDAGNHVRVIRQSQLELWQASDTSALLTVLKMRLFGFVSGLSTRNPVFPDQPFKGSWFQNMQNLLDEIKNVEVDDGIDILISEIHLELECLITLKVPHNCKAILNEKAREILAKWRPLFKRSLLIVHWVFEDAASLERMIYIPRYHGIRLSVHRLGMIYGMLPEHPRYYPENLDSSHYEYYR